MTPRRRAAEAHTVEARGVKTTIELPENVWRAAKIRALDDHSDLRRVVIAALLAYLGVSPRERADGH
jgi:hypothetical protein